MRTISFSLLLLGLSISAAAAQEWYIPKRTQILERGTGELGVRLQVSANNDGLLDTFRSDSVLFLRYTPVSRLEIYVDCPYSFIERENIENFSYVSERGSGIGDAFMQLSFEGFSGEDWKILYNLDTVFPTGRNPYKYAIAFGGGHTSVAMGQTAMKVIDPVVLFMHVGYRHTIARRFLGNKYSPGGGIRFRFGSGISLNPRVQTTLAVNAERVLTSKVNNQGVTASASTNVGFGWGIDWKLKNGFGLNSNATFGMTKNTPDATIAMGCSIGF